VAYARTLVESLERSFAELERGQRELQRQNALLVLSSEAIEGDRLLYEELFELAPFAHLVTDRNGLVLQASSAAAALLRRPARFLTRKPLAALVEQQSRTALDHALNEVGHSADSRTLDLEFSAGTGPRIVISATVAAMRGRVPRQLRWILRDVTTERQRELELRLLARDLEARVEEGARELTAVLDHLPVGVVLVDAATREIVRSNARAAELLGAAWDGVASALDDPPRADGPDGPPVDRDDWPSARAFRGETVLGERVHMRTPDGEELHLEFSAAPVKTAEGSVSSAVIVFQDVAERERREGAIRSFVTNAAHELGTPLAGIIAAVEALQSGAKDDEEARERFIHHIARESKRLDRLTRALLVLARAQARAERAKLDVVQVAPLLNDIASGLSPVEGVAIDVSCPSDVGVLANRSLLEQALTNLAANAARYTERGEIALTAQRDGSEVCVVVSDTGPGIPADVRERLFERFVRGGERQGGFGLGLAIARESVETIGGTLEIHSPPGGGTQAVVRLPGARLLDAA
jgi:two-component system phosphate regulon sensor histidine kinase PhoR